MSDGICSTCETAGCPWRSDMVFDCSHYTPKSETNYERLFGTPERTARMLTHNVPSTCDECVLIDICDIGMPATCMADDYDALLEWLRGESAEVYSALGERREG